MTTAGGRLREAADKLERLAVAAHGGGDWATWLGFAIRARHIPDKAAPWIKQMGPQVAEHLVLWLRSEAIQFETSERRGSPYGYPSWHFACQLLGQSPTDGGFDTLHEQEES